MSNTIKFKKVNGEIVTFAIDPSFTVVQSVDSDTKEHATQIVSPNYQTTLEHVGGRPKGRG